MIITKDDLHEYLSCDKQVLCKEYCLPKWNDDIWIFERALRFMNIITITNKM